MTKFAFIDRDGTMINEPQDDFQIDSLAKLEIFPSAVVGLLKLIKNGYKLVMISNQDGLGTDSFPQADFDQPQNMMLKILKSEGIEFYRIFVCPHLPEENCECRKPKLGLVKNFIKQEDIDYKKSIMVGDRDSDRQFADNLGVKFIKMETNGRFPEIKL